jgi:hypothetical protein
VSLIVAHSQNLPLKAIAEGNSSTVDSWRGAGDVGLQRGGDPLGVPSPLPRYLASITTAGAVLDNLRVDLLARWGRFDPARSMSARCGAA